MSVLSVRRRLSHRLRLMAPGTFAAAVWTVVSLRRARRSLRDEGFAARVSPPPRLPPRAGRGVNLVLRRVSGTCLERAMVEQAWLVAQGRPADVVIGVAAGSGEIKAHAWVEGLSDPEVGDYDEIHRITPDNAGSRPRR